MISKEKIKKILKLTAEAFSESPQSDMLDFFVEQREEKGLRGGPWEGWVKCEIVRKLDRNKDPIFDVDLKNVKEKDCDFEVDCIRIELDVSAAFTYKTLFDGIRLHKKADCWMFVSKYNSGKKRKMEEELPKLEEELSKKFYSFNPEMILKPNWCVIVVTEKQKLGS